MAETTWTPGPWFAREQFSREKSTLGWIIDHANGRIGWSCYATATPNEREKPPYPIGAANAHLIAAAPDLYAALEGLQRRIVEANLGHGQEDALDAAAAALAKARGE